MDWTWCGGGRCAVGVPVVDWGAGAVEVEDAVGAVEGWGEDQARGDDVAVAWSGVCKAEGIWVRIWEELVM